MTQLLRRFRGLAVALAVLAISAGAVFAAAPTFVPSGAPVANEEPASTPASENEDGDLDEDADADEGDQGEDADQDDQGEDADDDGEAPAAAEADAPAEGTHGALVSAAAQMETPEGFANHGAFVSCVAHMKPAADEEPVDLATVTPESCAAAEEARAAQKAAKAEARAAAKAERSAAREAARTARDTAKAERAAARAAAKAARLAARG